MRGGLYKSPVSLEGRSSRISDENAETLVSGKHYKKKKSRRSLQVLQHSAVNKQILVGVDGAVHSGSKIKNAKNPPNKHETVTVEKAVQTDGTQSMDQSVQATESLDVVGLMCSDSPSPDYWRLRCERLQAALEETLTENQNLHERVEHLEQEVDVLKEMADHAQELTALLEKVVSSDEESVKSDENPNIEEELDADEETLSNDTDQ